jgi:LPS-assembly lipoprotein
MTDLQLHRGSCWGLARAFGGLAVAILLAGCFQPLYGERSLSGGSAVREMLAGVDIAQISALPNTAAARMAVQIQNEVRFNLTGGAGGARPTHRLIMQISGGRAATAATNITGLPIMENFVLNATYTLTELGSNKVVVTGRTTTTVSYDPAGTQRFARISGMMDAERRAAKVVADNVTTRLASYFTSGS